MLGCSRRQNPPTIANNHHFKTKMHRLMSTAADKLPANHRASPPNRMTKLPNFVRKIKILDRNDKIKLHTPNFFNYRPALG
jgi:hypothetical protein